MNFYTQQHTYYCGIDLHAKAMYVCILDQSGTKLVHKNLPTTPEAFLRLSAPSREALVVGVECIFTWDWPAYKANREGVAEHFPDPGVRKTIEVDVALIDH